MNKSNKKQQAVIIEGPVTSESLTEVCRILIAQSKAEAKRRKLEHRTIRAGYAKAQARKGE